jgi:hypothetical protein
MDIISPKNVRFSNQMTPYESFKYGQQRYMQISKDNVVEPNNALDQLLTKYNPNGNRPQQNPAAVVNQNNLSTPSN